MGAISINGRSYSFPTIRAVAFLCSSITVVPFVSQAGLSSANLPRSASLLVWFTASLLMALVMSLALALRDRHPQRTWVTYLLPVALFVVGIGRALNIPLSGALKQYGDFGALRIHLSEPDTENNRWLLGLTLLREGFRALNEALTAVGVLSDGDIDPQKFVQIATALVMCLSAVWLLKRSETSVVPWMITTTPLWILFSVGYDEYYPFVAGLVIAAMWNVLKETPLFENSAAYVIVGLLPILYVGAFPISIALLLSCWSRDQNRRDRTKGAMVALMTAVVSIEVGGEFRGYFVRLSENLNAGGDLLDQELSAKGVGASSESIFGNLSYVFSVEHVVDIFFWLSCGAGIVVLVSPLLFSGQSIRHTAVIEFSLSRIGRMRLISVSRILLLVSALVFLVFMLPLLGTVRDIDLYFVSMFTLLLFAGVKLDEFIRQSENSLVLHRQIEQLISFGFAPATTALVVFGISR